MCVCTHVCVHAHVHVVCCVVYLGVKARRVCTVPDPHHFMACGPVCPKCFLDSHYCLSLVKWGAPVYSYRKKSVSSPQEVSALKTKIERKGAQL